MILGARTNCWWGSDTFYSFYVGLGYKKERLGFIIDGLGLKVDGLGHIPVQKRGSDCLADFHSEGSDKILGNGRAEPRDWRQCDCIFYPKNFDGHFISIRSRTSHCKQN
jgi:hypothetical protein